MPTLQWKFRALVVIEGRRRPSLDHVTIPTLCDAVLRGELAAMRIAVAGLAIPRGFFELYVARALNRLMTAGACHGPVSPQQRKIRL